MTSISFGFSSLTLHDVAQRGKVVSGSIKEIDPTLSTNSREQQISEVSENLILSYLGDVENVEKTQMILQQVIVQKAYKSNKRDSLKEEAAKYILLHANNQLSDQDFLESLIKPDERGELPIYAANDNSLLKILELVKEKGFAIAPAIIDTLFNKHAASENDCFFLSSILLNIRPEAINQTIGRKISYYSQALLQGRPLKAKILLEAMKTQHIELTNADTWIQKAIANDCDFTKEEFFLLPTTLRQQIYQVASMYMKMEFIQKLREFGIQETVFRSERQALFTCNMDAIDVRETLIGFLKNLRNNDLLLTKEEFNQKSPTQYYDKGFGRSGDAISRILGRDFIEKTTRRLGLSHVKVPRKIAVIYWMDKTLSLSIKGFGLTTSSLNIYAERITKIKRKATREEMLEVLTLVEEVGFNDGSGDNFWVGKNLDGEEGIFFIDTEYVNFSALPDYNDFKYLRKLMDPKDHEWLQEEIDQRKKLFAPLSAEKEIALKYKNAVCALIAKKQGYWAGRSIELSIGQIIPFIEKERLQKEINRVLPPQCSEIVADYAKSSIEIEVLKDK